MAFLSNIAMISLWSAVESLDILIATLNQASFDKGHINGLFFLAETVLYWLRTDAVNSPYLRLSEIKLLKVKAFLHV